MSLGESIAILVMMLILILAGMSLGSSIAKQEFYKKSIQEQVCKCEVKQ